MSFARALEVRLPGAGIPGAYWLCRHCPEGFGRADSIGEAGDAGREHITACPAANAGMDRLIAAVLAVPDVVAVESLSGAFCRSCDELVRDEHEHVEHHLVAAGIVEPQTERERLQAEAWADLAARAQAL